MTAPEAKTKMVDAEPKLSESSAFDVAKVVKKLLI
jgi:hypothetical protein